jgi:opacity protein-like surface antigen
MTIHTVGMMSLRNILVVPALWLATSTLALAADSASGTVSFQAAKGAVKYGFLVRGPDEMDPSKTVLRLYLSSVDIGAKIKACKTFSDADSALEDGAMVDFGDARHLGYAIRLNGERVQYSGGTNGEAFTLTTSKPDHLTGKVHIDDSTSGGAKVDATFDLTLVKTFTSLR